MTNQDVLDLLRMRLDTPSASGRWSDTQLYFSINLAQRRLVSRGLPDGIATKLFGAEQEYQEADQFIYPYGEKNIGLFVTPSNLVKPTNLEVRWKESYEKSGFTELSVGLEEPNDFWTFAKGYAGNLHKPIASFLATSLAVEGAPSGVNDPLALAPALTDNDTFRLRYIGAPTNVDATNLPNTNEFSDEYINALILLSAGVAVQTVHSEDSAAANQLAADAEAELQQFWLSLGQEFPYAVRRGNFVVRLKDE